MLTKTSQMCAFLLLFFMLGNSMLGKQRQKDTTGRNHNEIETQRYEESKNLQDKIAAKSIDPQILEREYFQIGKLLRLANDRHQHFVLTKLIEVYPERTHKHF